MPKPKAKQPASNDELVVRIEALRNSLTQMLENYRFRIDAELIQLAGAARGEGPYETKPRRLSAAAAKKMLQLIEAAELKPKKGRAKDFQRLQTLVAELSALLPNQQ